MMRYPLFLLLLLSSFLLASPARAANPILPGWEHVPDGEPRVFGDRVYLYGSHDLPLSRKYCDTKLVVWSAALNDLNNWRYEGHSFHTRADAEHPDDVPWSDSEFYAPDVVEKGGKYYLYAYVVGSSLAVGVSDSPAGPFKLLSKLNAPKGAPSEFGGWGQYIDPGVLVDTTGRAFIYWGYKDSSMAELNARTMIDVLPNTLIKDFISNKPPFKFFEASSIRKVGSTYYFIYADGGILVYATAKSPRGPLTYGGPIIRNGRDNPGGNIHGSICQINGQWYIFYHRMTNRTLFSRRACVERITIKPDGSIDEVEQTSLGFEESLNPYQETHADIACVLKHNPYVTYLNSFTQIVTGNQDGSIVGYKYFDFGKSAGSLRFTAEVRPAAAAGRMELWLDAVDTGRKLGEVPLPAAPAPMPDPQLNTHPWQHPTITVPPVTGRHALYFRFRSDTPKTNIVDLRTFRFQRPNP